MRLQNLRKGERRRPHRQSAMDEKHAHELRKGERRRANLQVTDITMKRNGYHSKNNVTDLSDTFSSKFTDFMI
ncbi:MAG: hypothetical protein ABL919_09995 [Methylococcales bacterium]|nr:hypothetical protein [Methylococcaceae bacterium]